MTKVLVITPEEYQKQLEFRRDFLEAKTQADGMEVLRAAMTEVDVHEILGWAADFLYTNRIPDDKVEKWPDYLLAHIKEGK